MEDDKIVELIAKLVSNGSLVYFNDGTWYFNKEKMATKKLLIILKACGYKH